jgi:predicted flap endonuclease-1-like 5' DNA nuclease
MMGRLVALVGAAAAAVGAMLFGRRAMRQRARERRKAERQAKRRRAGGGASSGAAPASTSLAPAPDRAPLTGDADETADATEPGFQSIKGIGPAIEERLREVGVTSVAQIAAWSDDDVEAVAPRLKVSSQRIHDQAWVEQAQRVLAGEPAG